jgi:hypothetical protein
MDIQMYYVKPCNYGYIAESRKNEESDVLLSEV